MTCTTTPRYVSAALIMALLVWSTPAASQAMGARGEDFLYRVMPRDTLIDLAKTFTHAASNWSTLQDINQIDDPFRLSIGRVLRIPFRLIPENPAQAVVRHAVGIVAVNGRTLRIDDQLSEGDVVNTGTTGSATLQLSDDSLLSVLPDSSLTIQRLQTFQGTGLTDSMFNMQSGSLESEVAPDKAGVGRFEIRTPVTITGVRGTHLRVHATQQGTRHEIVQGAAAVDSPRTPELAIGSGQGVAVDPQGETTGVRRLLTAPDLPTPVRGNAGWVMDFAPLAQAQSYLVRVTTDPQGAFITSTQTFASPPVTFSARGSGTHYVFVRAIDASGLGGLDAQRDFEGQTVLQSSTGDAVLSGFGEPIFLASD
ncbi:FecR domain-containing protein [Alcaligenaceae bacterium CGII-47]|nr:FecR domain-containing protein [Alcaligenaceae bacterium CGII-47]